MEKPIENRVARINRKTQRDIRKLEPRDSWNFLTKVYIYNVSFDCLRTNLMHSGSISGRSVKSSFANLPRTIAVSERLCPLVANKKGQT